MNHSFHGRSLGALSVTGNDHYREPFEPLISNIRFADYNDLASVEALISDNTAAVIMETIQGEGGIYPAKPEFIEGVRALCDKHNALMILDEIQCGMGRSGYMFAYQMYHVMPDVMLCAKALGYGVPVGAFVCNDRAASMTYGDHGTTYGGNPFVCTAVSEVFDIFKEDNIVEHVKEVGTYLWDRLEEMKEKYDCIVDHRGKGLIQGLEFTFAPKELVSKCLNDGLIVIAAENNTVRFVPPLIISDEDIDRMISILSTTIKV